MAFILLESLYHVVWCSTAGNEQITRSSATKGVFNLPTDIHTLPPVDGQQPSRAVNEAK